MKGLLLRISLLLVSTLFCLAILELVARQGLTYVARKSVGALGGAIEADPELLIEYTPRGRRLVPHADVVIHNHYTSGLDVDFKTNSIGLRDQERKAYPDKGTERIVFLGDSIVMQDYLPSEKSLPLMLERELNSKQPPRYEVINSGLSNAGLEEEIQLLSEVIDHLHPTIVLLSFYLNDSRPAWGYSGEMGAQRGWIRKHSIVAETILRELEVRQWLSAQKVERFAWLPLVKETPWKSDRNAFRKMAASAPYDWGSAWDEASWSGVERKLKELKQLVETKGARLLVVAMPVAYQVQAEFVEDEPQRRLGEILSSLEIPYHSLLEQERQHRAEDIFFDWCHPNHRGNQIMAPVIAEFVWGGHGN